jgi:purine-binding chemotaxis protein CheW
MKGVINLRGNVVPVVDMRLRFNMEVIEYTQVTVIIIVEVNERYVGMIVDTVSDVVGIPMSNIHESSSLSSDMEINSEFIQAIGQVDSQLIIILDVTRILESESVSR